jgi:polyferredoxin
MKVSPAGHRRRQRSGIFAALLLFNLVLVLLQLWLFVGVLESLLDGKTTMAIPAAILSLVILGVNVWMLDGVVRLTRDV